jgi:hypothetical protein
MIADAKKKKQPLSVGLLGNAAEIVPQIARGKFLPDIVTDQTSAHDPLNGYVPAGMSVRESARPAEEESEKICGAFPRLHRRARAGDSSLLKKKGKIVFDYGNNIRGEAQVGGVKNAFDIPGFVPEYIRPLVLRRQRTVPLGGALRRSGGYLPHGPRGARNIPREHPAEEPGSRKRRSKWRSRDFPRVSAGSGTASGRRWEGSSTISSAAAK